MTDRAGPTQISRDGLHERRGRLSSIAYIELRDRILSGEIPVGTALAEVELAATLGVSRTPVREALSKLLADGLLIAGRKRQLLVRGFSAEHRAEVLDVREALELLAVSRACKVLTIEEIDELRNLLQRQHDAALMGDDEGFIALDEEFHLALARGARLPIVLRMLDQLGSFVRLMSLGTTRPTQRLEEVHREHQAIVDAVEARDEQRAIEVLTNHLRRAAHLSTSDADRERVARYRGGVQQKSRAPRPRSEPGRAR